ncbi:MAG TPA: arsenic resistance N-acetyltransferase ArsN2 [Acidimicrobiia bacterium]|nr:arsenic resistance N-acetyltransferase ArsN2 [Acidimicrobiia bacterium]
MEPVAGTPADLPEILALLTAAGLPAARLGEHGPTDLFVVRVGGRLVGAAALEHHDGDGLLRSVVVAEELRGTGLGRRLTEAALAAAAAADLRSVRLLTETAPGFFAHLGFERFDRSDAPPAIAASEEFAVACPDSAVAMMR